MSASAAGAAARTPTLDALGDVTEGARGLVAASVSWMTRDTTNATLALAVAAGLFVAFSALRRVIAPSEATERPLADLGPGAILRRVLQHTKDWFLFALSLELTSAWFAVPERLMRGADVLFTFALTWQAALWVRALILALVSRRAAAADAHQLANALDVIRILVTVLIFALAAIVVLDNLGANVTGLVAGLGIGGVAIGLAAQGVMGDLFAALSIIFDRPFVRGESISFDGFDGTVEATGLKTTRIRALTGEEIVISNANLLGKVIRNSSRLGRRRVTLNFGLVYATPPDAAAAVPEVLGALVGAREHCSFIRAGLTGFGESAIDYTMTFDVQSDEFELFVRERHAVIAGMLRRFAELGLQFAYPTQVQLLAAPDGRLVDPREVRKG